MSKEAAFQEAIPYSHDVLKKAVKNLKNEVLPLIEYLAKLKLESYVYWIVHHCDS